MNTIITPSGVYVLEMCLNIQAAALAPSFIFHDEGDSLVTRRTTDSTALYSFLGVLDGMPSNKNIVTMVATNATIDSIDEAVCRPGRLEMVHELSCPKIRVNIHSSLGSIYTYSYEATRAHL